MPQRLLSLRPHARLVIVAALLSVGVQTDAHARRLRGLGAIAPTRVAPPAMRPTSDPVGRATAPIPMNARPAARKPDSPPVVRRTIVPVIVPRSTVSGPAAAGAAGGAATAVGVNAASGASVGGSAPSGAEPEPAPKPFCGDGQVVSGFCVVN